MSNMVQTGKARKTDAKINKRKVRLFTSNFVYFHDQYERFKKEFADQYVAIFNKQVVDHDVDAEALVKRLSEKYGDLGAFVIEYVSSQKVELIL